MAKVKRWIVISSKPELVTLKNGDVVSLPRGHEPVDLQMDSKFVRLKEQRKIQHKWVVVDDDPAPPAPPAPAPIPEPEEPAEELEAEDIAVSDLGFRHSVESALVGAGITTLSALRAKVDEDGLDALTDLKGIGEASLTDIADQLSKTD